MINKQNTKDIYPLSPMQESMLFHTLLDEGSNAYFEQTLCTIIGKFDTNLFKQVLDQLFDRHDILRTVFVYRNVAKPLQVVLKKVEPMVCEADISHIAPGAVDAEIQRIRKADRNASFKLDSKILMRIQVLRINDEEVKLIWSHHHILMDGWCMGIIIKEFLELYAALANNKTPYLPPVVPYNTFIKWLGKQDKEASKQFWTNYLSDVEQESNFAGLYNKNASSYVKKIIPFEIEESLFASLRQTCIDLNITPNTLIQSLWGVLLSKYCYSHEVVFGSVVSGRPAEIPNVESILGLFINTVPFKVELKDNDTFKSILQRGQTQVNSTLPHQYLPLAEIQNGSNLKNNLINHILIYQNYPNEIDLSALDTGRFGFRIKDIDTFEQTNYDLNLSVFPDQGRLKFKYDFNENAYSTTAIHQIQEKFEDLIRFALSNLDTALQDFAFSGASEDLQQIKHKDYSETIIDRIENRASLQGENIAIFWDNKSYTYSQLLHHANGIAQELEKLQVGSGDLVALYLDRSFEAVAAMLGVLKSGAAYVPIDKSLPIDRVNFMLQDAAVKVLLTDEQTSLELPIIDVREIKAQEQTINKSKITERAYVIYTSGSTGLPKGCELSHENLFHYLDWASEYYPQHCGAEGNSALYTSISFDLTVTGIFMPLLLGKSISIYPQHQEIEQLLPGLFSNPQVDLIKITPAHISVLPFLNIETTKVKGLIVGGEELKASHVSIVKKLNPDIVIFNEYGPTETTVGCAIKTIHDPNEEINIGTAIDRMEMIVLDKSQQIAPAGAHGELAIAGQGVGIAYLNRAELSNEKFIKIKGTRVYRTGDLGMRLPNGELQFLGRLDNQVKIRGYRIELGEIENKLLTHPSVLEAVVLDKKDKQDLVFLCAYILTDKSIDPNEVKQFLAASLPDYMVPSFIVELDKIPLTVNGKVDKRKLPEPEGANSGAVYVAPENETQEKLVEIWKQILGIEGNDKAIGINDHFFDLGGHSLKSIMLSSRILKEFGKQIGLRQLYENLTIKAISELITSDILENNSDEIKAVPPADYYPASAAQKRMYLLQEFDKSGVTYNIPVAVEIGGKLDLDRLASAFNQLIARHESMRTSFAVKDNALVQIIHDEVSFDIKQLAKESIDEALKKVVKPFDLSKAPLLRVAVMPVKDEQNVLFIDLHHIVSDAVSSNILINDLVKLYAGNTPEALTIQYKDYSVWQNNFFESEKAEKLEKYWLNKFEEEIPVLNLPTDFPRPIVQSFEGLRHVFTLSEELSKKINQLANKMDSTLYMSLLAVYNVLLSKYTGQNDIIVGSPIAGRLHADLENIMGMFINTLAMRNAPDEQKTFKDFLMEVKENALDAYENQNYPFDQLVEKLKIRRDLSRNPLFDTLFVLQNATQGKLSSEGMTFKLHEHESGIAKFDLSLYAYEKENGLQFILEYSTKLFRPETIERIAAHFVKLLEEIVAQPDKKLGEYSIISEAESQQILVDFNDTFWSYDADTTIQEKIETQAAMHPDKTALVFNGEKLSYGQLNAKANQLAHKLRKIGVGADDRVAIQMNRSTEMVIGILAVLKAGGAYMPLDPKMPAERLKFLLKDSAAKAILCLDEEQDYSNDSITVLNLRNQELFGTSVENPEAISKPDNLAYVIYTSGSTGTPKGVMLENRQVVAFEQNMTAKFGISSEDRVLAVTNITFDISVLEILCSLMIGAEIVLAAENEIEDLYMLAGLIEKEQVNVMQTTPSRMKLLIERCGIDALQNLKTILVGGEALPPALADKLRSLEQTKCYNVYGPTEACIWSTVAPLSEDNGGIGKPLLNEQVYVLSGNSQLQPIGVPGELCIAGSGLARAYMNQPELTATQFVAHPWKPGERLYKTGDLVKWFPDGRIDYLGRIDHQVKIRGFRIELGDIESQLLKIGFTEVTVLDKTDKNGDKFLCAYIVSKEELNLPEIKATLAKDLPEYMIPSYFVRLEQMPLNTSGKLNRKALPEPDASSLAKAEYRAPETETQKQLAAIWEQVLGVEKIGLSDNFFDLGGHSLKATLLVTKLNRHFEISVSITDIFRFPELGSFADFMETMERSKFARIEKIEDAPYYEVSSAQRRIFLLQQFDKQSTQYNIPLVLKTEEKIDKLRFEAVLNQLIQRHENLRTVFKLSNGKPIQIVNEARPISLPVLQANQWNPNFVDDFIQAFDLEKDNLLRVQLIEIGSETYLLFDIHHIAADAISMEILIREFLDAYRGIQLEPLKIQYRDYAAWQHEFSASKKYAQQKAYWLEQFSGTLSGDKKEIPVLQLPYDYPRPVFSNFVGDEIKFTIDGALSDKIKSFCKEQQITPFALFMSAFSLLLHKLSGQNEIVIGTPVSGRVHADLEQLIGMFVNTLAIKSQISEQQAVIDYVKQYAEDSLMAIENQNYPFDELVDSLDIRRDTSRNPLFDVMLSYQQSSTSGSLESDLQFTPVAFETKVAKFDLTCFIHAMSDGTQDAASQYVVRMEYATSLFTANTIQKYAVYFKQLLHEMVAQQHKTIAAISILTESEKNHILVELNRTETKFESKNSVLDYIDTWRSSDVALVFGEKQISYQELHHQADCLVAYFNGKIGKGDKVILLMDRSDKMIISLLAVLKTGAAYVPIDPSLPEERVNYIISNANAKVVLTDRNDLETQAEIIHIEDDWAKIMATNPQSVTGVVSGNDPAYLIYTSGSTGLPKGCVLTHANLLHYIQYANSQYFESIKGNFPLYTSISFDLTITSIFSTLSRGKTLYITPQDQEVDQTLKNIFSHADIDVVKITPAHIGLLKTLELQTTNIKAAIVGGDQMTMEHAKILRALNPKMRIFNEYGPTETTVGCVVKEIENEITIGKPISNMQAYVLDANLQPVAQGVTAQLYLSGAGVGLGYHQLPELTAERFIPHPWIPNQKMYVTGDLAYWNKNEELVFVGRNDFQVKIRGYRIELGEIEQVLLGQDGMTEVLVITDSGFGDPVLVAYFVNENAALDTANLKAALAKRLPDYMIPQFFMQLEQFPLNANGKIDRKALPSVEALTAEEEIVAAETNIQEALLESWKAILKKDEIGVESNFFALGGDSIKAIQVASRMQKFGLKIEVRDIFTYPTIRQVEPFVKEMTYRAEQGLISGDFPLSPIQQAFFESKYHNPNHYNQGMMLFSAEKLELTLIEQTFRKLVEHHDALRFAYVNENGKWIQRLDTEADSFSIHEFEGLSNEAIEAEAAALQTQLSIENGKLIALGLFHTETGSHLSIAIHHLVVDGISWRILLEDIENLFTNQSLAPKTQDFGSWSQALTELAGSSKIQQELHYWKGVLKDISSHWPGATQTQANLAYQEIRLSEEQTQALLTEINKAYNTEINEILMAALTNSLSKFTGKTSNVLFLEGHGREEILERQNINRTVGWFTTVFPVKLEQDEDLSMRIKNAKDNLRKIPNKGIGYGILKYLNPDVSASQDLQAPMEINFNYLGQFDFSADAGQDEKKISISPLSFGPVNDAENQRESVLDLTGMIYQNQLRMTVSYNQDLFSQQDIDTFATDFKSDLEAIITHCLAKDSTEMTISDFDSEDLTYEELDDIMGMLDDL